MLLATSLICVLLCGACSFLYITTRWLPHLVLTRATKLAVLEVYYVAFAWRDLIYAYNFFVYLIIGKQFRSELRRLFCICHSAAAAAAIDNVRLSRRGQAVTEMQMETTPNFPD